MMDRASSAGYLTNRAARLFVASMDRRLSTIGLSIGQMPVLLALGDGAAMSQKALTLDAAIQQPTMAATLARMERDGLVETRPDPVDRRSTLYALTVKALDKCEQVRDFVSSINDIAFGGLSADERQLYLALLSRVSAALEAHLDEST